MNPLPLLIPLSDYLYGFRENVRSPVEHVATPMKKYRRKPRLHRNEQAEHRRRKMAKASRKKNRR